MRLDMALFSRARWFHPESVKDYDEISRAYYDGQGYLPRNVPLKAIATRDWIERIALPLSIINPQASGLALGVAFLESVRDLILMFQAMPLVPRRFNLENWQYRSIDEAGYIGDIMTWGNGDSIHRANQLWRGKFGVSQEAMFCTGWCCQVAKELLWEAHDKWRLFWLPSQLRSDLLCVQCSIVLGSRQAHYPFHLLVREIGTVRWYRFSFNNTSRQQRPENLSIGRAESAGGWMGIDPTCGMSFCSLEMATSGRLPQRGHSFGRSVYYGGGGYQDLDSALERHRYSAFGAGVSNAPELRVRCRLSRADCAGIPVLLTDGVRRP